MAKLKITAPQAVTENIAGVGFVKGVAEVDDKENRRALAYFRRRGYKIEKPGRKAAPPKDTGDGAQDKTKSDGAIPGAQGAADGK